MQAAGASRIACLTAARAWISALATRLDRLSAFEFG